MVDLASTAMEYEDIENGKGMNGKHIVLPNADQLPNSIIVTNVPTEVYDNAKQRANFAELFTNVDEAVHFDFLKSFKRVRMIFSAPEKATEAKLIIDEARYMFNGSPVKAFFGHRVNLPSSPPLLGPPPLEKQWLISPPCSPPVGWESTREMAPVVCSFDLMARLAAFAVDDQYEVHTGGDNGQPRIVVSPCETPVDAPSALEMPRTPRPSTPADE